MLRALLLLLAAGTLAAAPQTPIAPAHLAAPAIVSKAFSRANDIPIAPYLSYDYSITLQHGSKIRTYRYHVLERLADHYGRFTGINPDGTLSQDIHLHKTLVSPAFFLKSIHTEADMLGGAGVIAGSVVVPYDVRLLGTEAAGDCPAAYHVELTPKFDPAKHHLRALWIDTASGRICRAQEMDSVYIITKEPTIIDMIIGPGDMVKHWTLTGTGHLLLGTYTLTAGGVFTDVEGVETASDRLFR